MSEHERRYALVDHALGDGPISCYTYKPAVSSLLCSRQDVYLPTCLTPRLRPQVPEEGGGRGGEGQCHLYRRVPGSRGRYHIWNVNWHAVQGAYRARPSSSFQRHKLGSNLTPVTPESFAKWKRTRMDKKAAEEEAVKKAKETQQAAGKFNGMSGRDLVGGVGAVPCLEPPTDMSNPP